MANGSGWSLPCTPLNDSTVSTNALIINASLFIADQKVTDILQCTAVL